MQVRIKKFFFAREMCTIQEIYAAQLYKCNYYCLLFVDSAGNKIECMIDEKRKSNCFHIPFPEPFDVYTAVKASSLNGFISSNLMA